MLTICSSCGLLTSSSQHRSGCKVATTSSTRRTVSMAESSNNIESSLFTTNSNEHTVFAGTLRDWCDPLLQGHEPIRVPLCPRCATCRCESLKILRNTHRHHHHEPSCPNYRHHERAKTTSKQRLPNKPKRRANSYDPSITSNNHSSLIKPQAEHSSSSPSTDLMKRKKSTSKIPIRIRTTSSSSTVTTTPASEYSPASSINEKRSANIKTRIPRPISNQNLSLTNIFVNANQTTLSSDEDLESYDRDSLNEDAYQTPPPMSNSGNYNKDLSPKKKKKNIMTMYCTTNHFDNMDDELLIKTKKNMSLLSSNKHNRSSSTPEKPQRRFWQHKEGRHSKSKPAAVTGEASSSPINDLSSSTSSLKSSSFSNNGSSSNQSRKKFRPYRLASPSQVLSAKTNTISTLSDDSLSEKSEQSSNKRRPRSALTTYEYQTSSTHHFESTPPPPPVPSVYLIEFTNPNRPTNSFGLSKTITYVWKSNHQKKEEEDLNNYPRYSIEQVPPIIDQDQRSIPTSSRHITLQRGKTDYWQSMKTSPDSMLTSSCQNHIGSATNLLSPTFVTKQKEIKPYTKSNGHIISVTTTKRRQPSLLNQSQNTQWNIEGDGKQLRYSNLKWHSVDQLHNDNHSITKHRNKRKQQEQRGADSTTDTGSSSEQHNRSAPPILQRIDDIHVTNGIHQVFENILLNKQTDLIIPDYSMFHRDINDTSSPIHPEEDQLNSSSSSSSSSSPSSASKEIQHFETIIKEHSTPPAKPKLNSYASTDEDVDELNLDFSEDIDHSTRTIQTYRDRLNARLNNELEPPRLRIQSTEYSQATLDSGVDIASEQKTYQPIKIDEHYSEETTNQNDLFALSDDSLLDIESPPPPPLQLNDFLLKTPPPTIQEQSLTEESDEGGRSYLTAINDFQLVNKTERGPSNTSDQYYSAESEFNTSLAFPNNDPYSGYELVNVSDDEEEDRYRHHYRQEEIENHSPERSPSPQPQFDFKLPSFGDWIDRVFTTFLAETNQESASTSRSSSIISLHTSQNTIDTSSSQIMTVIENNSKNQNVTIISRNPVFIGEDNNQSNNLHRRSQSWPSDEQLDDQDLKDMSSSSLNNENTNFDSYAIDSNYEKINSPNVAQDQNKRSKSSLLSSIETSDEEVINEGTMQSDYLHHPPTSSNNGDQFHSDDEDLYISNTTSNKMTETVEEKERDDQKHIETGADDDDDDNNKNEKPLIQLTIPDDSSSSLFYEGFHYREQPHQHTNSHDSLLQNYHHTMNTTNTAASSTDDLSTTHQLSSSAFHSKDSALGLSDDNLNCLQSNQLLIIDDDDDDDNDNDDQQQPQQILSSSSSLKIQHDDKTVDNNDIQDNANNNIDKNEMICERNNDNENIQINNTMICINEPQPHLLSTSYLTEPTERTISSSSSEQLIPKEKQTGMYYPAFGSSAAIHLAEKYHCEWLQDVTSPSSTIRKSSTIVETENLADVDDNHSRIVRQHQTIGDEDEFYLSPQTLLPPSYSCPQLNHLITRDTLRERSYSLTTLDAYARLDITRDTLEQMWLSLLDLAFSDKDDFELGEYKLRHIMGLSNSYTNMNETVIEKSRSHGDIFSTTNTNPKFLAKKSKSFDITSLPKPTTDNSANIGLLQGAAISEPFVDREKPTSTHSDTEENLLDIDHDSIQSYERDNLTPEEQYSPINQTATSPIIKEPLNYVFHYPHQLDNNDDFDLEPSDDITNYLPEKFSSTMMTTTTTNQIFGEEDKQLCMSLGFDDDEATAALVAAVVQPRDTYAELSAFRPHSLSTIPSSRESQYESSIDDSDELRKGTISLNHEEVFQSEHSDNEEDDDDDDEDDRGEIGSDFPSPQSRPLSPIQSRSQTPPEQNQQVKLSNFSDIDHDAWARSISEPIYSENLSIQYNTEQELFPFKDNNLTNIKPIEQSELFTIDEIEPIDSLNDNKQENFIEQTTITTIENNLIDFSSQEDFIEKMDSQQEINKSTNSTRTSISSSIHDTHLDPNELAFRLARLDSSNITSPPKKTLADELAELGEQHHPHFEHDSLDHSPPADDHHHQQEQNQEKIESLVSSPARTYSLTSPLNIDQLTSMAKDIRQINQETAVSSLSTIVQDIHAETNNKSLTRIVDYHHSPPIANLQTLVTELHQTPIGQSMIRPERPTHLQLETEEEEEEQILSPVRTDKSPILSNIEQPLISSKPKSPSPPLPPPPPSQSLARRISEPLIHSSHYQTQRIDKVSDLEIVKQGKGFKIGYVDRQGTDQRVILTKRIEAGPDIMARDPHVRLPYKGRKILNQISNSVLYTNGYNTIQEDKHFQRTSDDIEVPIIGTNPEHFDESDMISIDIDGPSTMLNSICESIVITQGSVYSSNTPKPPVEKPIIQSVSKSIFDNNLSHSQSSRLRHVILDQHEEYLLDSSRTPTPSTKKEKIEVIDTWQDRTVIEGSSATWRSPSLPTYKATKHIQPSTTSQHFISTIEPNIVQMRIAPSHDIKYRTSEHIEVPAVFDWTEENVDTPKRSHEKTTRDIALSPIIVDKKYQTTSTSPVKHRQTVDRSCQYSPPARHDLGLQCRFENVTSSTQVSSYDIPSFLITHDGTQTINDLNTPRFDDSGIQTHIQTISPSLSITSSENQQTTQPFVLSGDDFVRKLNEQRTKSSTLTVTQYTDGNYYLPSDNNNTNNHQATMNSRPTTLERSADSGILVDDNRQQSSRNHRTKANFALQVDIKGSSSDSEDVSEATQRPLNRIKPTTNGDIYEHHSELVITPRHTSKHHHLSTTEKKRFEQPSSAKEIEQQILQLRRERTHILDLLSLNWNRSNIWVELTEAKLNYIIGETDALLRSLSFDTSPVDSEIVKLKMHQYEEDMAELTRQRLAVYRERLEDSKKQLDIKIDELELRKSSIEHNRSNHTSHYSTLQYTPRLNNKRSNSFLSTSAENLTNMPIQDTISSHPHLLDVSFLTSTPSNQPVGLPPRYPRLAHTPQEHQLYDTYRTVYRPTPRYPPTTLSGSNEHRYDYPRYRTTSYVTPNGNLSGMQGLSKSQQAILDETDKLVKDSQQFHSESASQFERARESLLSSETPIRLARANMAASRRSPNSNYLPNDVTLAELFKYEQSLAKETAKNNRTYSTISTSAES